MMGFSSSLSAADVLEILPETLLMDAPGTLAHDSTNWREDVERELSKDA
jgi:hypothetical protein